MIQLAMAGIGMAAIAGGILLWGFGSSRDDSPTVALMIGMFFLVVGFGTFGWGFLCAAMVDLFIVGYIAAMVWVYLKWKASDEYQMEQAQEKVRYLTEELIPDHPHWERQRTFIRARVPELKGRQELRMKIDVGIDRTREVLKESGSEDGHERTRRRLTELEGARRAADRDIERILEFLTHVEPEIHAAIVDRGQMPALEAHFDAFEASLETSRREIGVADDELTRLLEDHGGDAT